MLEKNDRWIERRRSGVSGSTETSADEDDGRREDAIRYLAQRLPSCPWDGWKEEQRRIRLVGRYLAPINTSLDIPEPVLSLLTFWPTRCLSVPQSWGGLVAGGAR